MRLVFHFHNDKYSYTINALLSIVLNVQSGVTLKHVTGTNISADNTASI